ncbi:MAG: hypothetical protein ABSC95_11480 [Acetobacteraceae bacterium]
MTPLDAGHARNAARHAAGAVACATPKPATLPGAARVAWPFARRAAEIVQARR